MACEVEGFAFLQLKVVYLPELKVGSETGISGINNLLQNPG